MEVHKDVEFLLESMSDIEKGCVVSLTAHSVLIEDTWGPVILSFCPLFGVLA